MKNTFSSLLKISFMCPLLTWAPSVFAEPELRHNEFIVEVEGMGTDLLKETPIKHKAILAQEDINNYYKSLEEPEDLTCRVFPKDLGAKNKFIPSVFHTPMGDEGGTCELTNEKNQTLAKVDCDLKKKCLMQGVCILEAKDGAQRGYNFIKFKNSFGIKKSVFAVFNSERCPFGYGVWSKKHNKAICMDPFRSVAADTKYHKPGDVLFFPALRGLKLSDSTLHDGFMTVRSSGGHILGPHRFDFYTGLCKDSHKKLMLCKDMGVKTFRKIGLGEYQKIKDKSCFYTYFKVKKSLKIDVLKERNFPGLPAEVLETSLLDQALLKATDLKSEKNIILKFKNNEGKLLN